jgi:hypothetical protein
MPAAGRSRNQPCFCGSGRKLKHCCARQLTQVRTWSSETTRCRWRFWAPHNHDERYASELAEHICAGERVWIARGTPDGTSWMIDENTVTLLEVLDHLPGAHYQWVIAQTMTALNAAAPTDDTAETDNPDDLDTPILGEVHQLMIEVLKLAHASDELTAQLPFKTGTTPFGAPGLQLRDRAWIQLAS